MGKDDEEIQRILGMSYGAFRTAKYRIKKRALNKERLTLSWLVSRLQLSIKSRGACHGRGKSLPSKSYFCVMYAPYSLVNSNSA